MYLFLNLMFFNQLIGFLKRFKRYSHESVHGKIQKFIDMSRKSVFEKLFNRKSDLRKRNIVKYQTKLYNWQIFHTSRQRNHPLIFERFAMPLDACS